MVLLKNSDVGIWAVTRGKGLAVTDILEWGADFLVRQIGRAFVRASDTRPRQKVVAQIAETE